MVRSAVVTARLKPYPEMHDSGVEWLGEVPARWGVKRLKSIVRHVSEKADGPRESMQHIALEHVESWTGRVTPNFAESAESQLKRFESGDLLFGKLRPYLAKVVRANFSGQCVGEFLVLRATDRISVHFLEHLLRSKPAIDWINSSTYGARMPRADWQFVGSTKVAVPPLPEQIAIARFLDHTTSCIDRYIRAKEELLSLLEEQKQVIIQDAVTGRIDVRTGKPYPTYKPSGVDWLENVPAHWYVSALRLRYSQCLGKMLDTSRIKGNHLVPYLRNVDVQWDRINVSDLPEMDITPAEYERYTVRQGDLLVCEGGEVGRCAIWESPLDVCGFQKALHRLRPHDARRDLVRHLYFAFQAAVQREAFNDGHQSTIAHLTGEKLRAHRFPFPPTSEQEAIVGFLEAAVAKNDRSLGTVRRQINLVRDFRTRLIALNPLISPR